MDSQIAAAEAGNPIIIKETEVEKMGHRNNDNFAKENIDLSCGVAMFILLSEAKVLKIH